MSSSQSIHFSIPGKCEFEMMLDLSRRTQRMIAESQELSGFYEGVYSLFVAALLKHGDTVVDVGAHVGYFTLLCASLVGPKGRVYAFEPEPENFRALTKNIALNGFENVTPIRSAVGSETGSVSLYFNSDNDGGHAVWDVQRDPNNLLSRRDARRFESPRTTLDEDLGDLPSVEFVKIDAEGSELPVLKGARRLLEKQCIDWIMWERNEEAFEKMGYSETDVRAFVSAFGYSVSGFRNNRMSRLSPDEILSPGCELNLFFSKTKRK